MWDYGSFLSNIACIDENGAEISYAEMAAAPQQFLRFIEPRKLVFSFCENSIGSLIGYNAFLSGRIVPLLLDSNMDNGLAKALIAAYRPGYIWLPEGRAMPEYRVIFKGWGYSLLQTGLEPFPLYKDLALLVTTSGSTGSPKLVRQSYGNIKSNTRSIVEYLKITNGERPITTLPMNYVYGTSVINSHLSQGATVLLTTKAVVQKEFWRFFRDYNATSIAGVPYTYEMLSKLRFTRMKLPSLRTMTQAGGKLHPVLHREYAEYASGNGVDFVIMYGAAEATARMGYLPPGKALEKCGSMGIPIPGGRFELIDEAGRVTEASSAVGELVYYGDNVTLGYARHGEDLIKGDERGGRYETGDMAIRDEDGYYTIVGRKKRFLKIFGNRISLDEIERLLNGAFPEMECACGGVDDRMTVFTTISGTSKDIVDFLTEKTGLNHKAFKVEFIEEIPRNDAGKILYSELDKLND